MRVHVLQHVPFEGLGSIQPWLASRAAVVTWTRFFEAPDLRNLTKVDAVIALGGPMSVNDEAELPWLREEKRFVREAIASGLPVLGICLGAQLIASSLGARVYAGPQKEIGWFPIRACDAPATAFRFPDQLDVFHWHVETFDLPPGAVHLPRAASIRRNRFARRPPRRMRRSTG
jgi:GMP synthase-like glutamine amidotransferase